MSPAPSHRDQSNADTLALVVAAGEGLRARGAPGDPPKQFALFAGKPLLVHALGALCRHPAIGHVVAVLPAAALDDPALLGSLRAAVPAPVGFSAVAGGSTRRHSVLAGLRAGAACALPHTLIHDGARPFVTPALVDRVLEGLRRAPGAVPCLAVTDTLKALDAANLIDGPDRDTLRTVQTPQGFRFPAILDAHEQVDAVARAGNRPLPAFTDDASILHWAGQPSAAVAGDPDNIKITTADDWARARAILSSREDASMQRTETRSGMGYDTHRLVPGDGVWLCGHFIAHTQRLEGHSDADVGLHALTDALLGAIGAGDIGTHFPPSDPQWKGAASHQFLRHAAGLVRARGGRIVNVDVAIIAERPKVGPHREAMVAAMAQMLGVTPDRVSVKATTNERMGFAGREEGIAALATASVEVPRSDAADAP